MPRAAPTVGGGCEEHTELVDLQQQRRLAMQRGQEPGARSDLVAAEMPLEPGLEEELVNDLAGVVLARAAVGDANDVEVRRRLLSVRYRRPISAPRAQRLAPSDSNGCGRRAVEPMWSRIPIERKPCWMLT